MVLFNLAVLLAERNLKITKVSSDTGISRTTLTSLMKNNAQGVQLTTINTLCQYLETIPGELFSYVPYDFSIFETNPYLFLTNEGYPMNENEKPLSMPFKIVVTQNNTEFEIYLIGNIQLEKTVNKSLCTISISFDKSVSDDKIQKSERVYSSYIYGIRPQFIHMLNECIFDLFEPHYEFFLTKEFDSVKINWII